MVIANLLYNVLFALVFIGAVVIFIRDLRRGRI